MPDDSGLLRIGEFARRVGVRAELLRAWERRYGLLRPVRSPGGYRLYTEEDAARVARMRRGIEAGISAAEAARLAVQDTAQTALGFERDLPRLMEAVRAYDESTLQEVLDRGLATFGLESALRGLILPALAEVGGAWERGELEVSHEHFASNVIRGRLLSMGRLWGRGSGPLALLACVPQEEHDIGLLCFGLSLRSYGWRILFLGADTPISTVSHAARETRPSLVVLSSVQPTLFEAEVRALRTLERCAPLMLSGPGATEELCARIGADRLNGDIVEAAAAVARGQGDSLQ